MEKQYCNLLIGAIVLIIIFVLWSAHTTGRLDTYYAKIGIHREPFCADLCSSTPAPGAAAEYYGLHQMGWRQEPFASGNNSCATVDPAALAEAHGLQHVGALSRNAPYHTKSPFVDGAADIDDMSAHKMARDQAAYTKAAEHHDGITSGHMSAHRARQSGMSEGFDGDIPATQWRSNGYN